MTYTPAFGRVRDEAAAAAGATGGGSRFGGIPRAQLDNGSDHITGGVAAAVVAPK